ncbi:TerB family tellurite resistance protein [uncultured Dokdonia sp.]|uniref:tellurite resistance TerB family protein n=1 Tax=uncultured Dokdonia sp. TaxID=575653 RepID=UPI002614A476|nr:TerB family tellurite resistance protein [uncultured Dokdonia sp.]
MSISELYESGGQKNNIAHFAAIANVAIVDGEANEQEKALLLKFAHKLSIPSDTFDKVIKNPGKYPINPPSVKEERLEYLYDLFKMIFVDHNIDEHEMKIIHRYAIGLGSSSEAADELIKKSIKIFSGNIDFEDYQYLITKKN